MTRRRSWVWLVGGPLLSCSPQSDLVGYITSSVQADGGSFSDAGIPTRLELVGRPLQNWPYAIVDWPLTTPLAEFFSAGSKQGQSSVVRLEGAEVIPLVELWQRTEAGEFSPSGNLVGVRDATGDEYLLTLKAR